MNNDIKEILDKLNDCKWEKDEEKICYKILFGDEVYKLLDYITILYQKCEYLERSNNRREEEIIDLRNECNDYLSRIDRLKQTLNKYEIYD